MDSDSLREHGMTSWREFALTFESVLLSWLPTSPGVYVIRLAGRQNDVVALPISPTSVERPTGTGFKAGSGSIFIPVPRKVRISR
jgi:hypothetical protein